MYFGFLAYIFKWVQCSAQIIDMSLFAEPFCVKDDFVLNSYEFAIESYEYRTLHTSANRCSYSRQYTSTFSGGCSIRRSRAVVSVAVHASSSD
eukprot:scaffold173510_cov17-Prasinocladus_malaysianus.AAC.1